MAHHRYAVSKGRECVFIFEEEIRKAKELLNESDQRAIQEQLKSVEEGLEQWQQQHGAAEEEEAWRQTTQDQENQKSEETSSKQPEKENRSHETAQEGQRQRHQLELEKIRQAKAEEQGRQGDKFGQLKKLLASKGISKEQIDAITQAMESKPQRHDAQDRRKVISALDEIYEELNLEPSCTDQGGTA